MPVWRGKQRNGRQRVARGGGWGGGAWGWAAAHHLSRSSRRICGDVSSSSRSYRTCGCRAVRWRAVVRQAQGAVAHQQLQHAEVTVVAKQPVIGAHRAALFVAPLARAQPAEAPLDAVVGGRALRVAEGERGACWVERGHSASLRRPEAGDWGHATRPGCPQGRGRGRPAQLLKRSSGSISASGYLTHETCLADEGPNARRRPHRPSPVGSSGGSSPLARRRRTLPNCHTTIDTCSRHARNISYEPCCAAMLSGVCPHLLRTWRG